MLLAKKKKSLYWRPMLPVMKIDWDMMTDVKKTHRHTKINKENENFPKKNTQKHKIKFITYV